MNNHTESPIGAARVSKRFHCSLGLLLLSALLMTPLEALAAGAAATPVLPPFVPAVPAIPFLQQVLPFNIIGFIQSATLDPACTAHPYCGGTVKVNGATIVVPQNTIFQFPATAMTWEDAFTNAPAAYKALGQSGLAMSDTPKPLTTYEINVAGNRVINGAGDQYIAGLIFMSQHAANANQGVIHFINYNTGDIWIGQPLGSGPSGARIRLNTPNARYGNPDPGADPRFMMDEDNPTIKALTGYPMCLPRVDPIVGNDAACPQWNRPRDPMTGAFSTNFTMPAGPAGVPDALGITHQAGYPAPAITPDPFEQAPLQIGDYITVAGTLTADAAGAYISAHTVTAQVAIYTAPGTWPVYTMLGPFSISVAGAPNPIFPVEALPKFVAEAFTTDPSQLLDIYAVDVNPCTGARTHRFYGAADPFGPPVGGVRGRGLFTATIGNFLPPTREIRVASRSLTHGAPLDTVLPAARKTANGLTAGAYLAPDFDFIFTANLVLGSPSVPLVFEGFPFLVNGSGPYARFADGVVVPPPGVAGGVGGLGQLKPWPSGASLPTACTTGQSLIQPPVSNAGSPQTVPSGAPVTLNASLSVDTNVPRLPLIYTWQQSGGPTVSLSNPSLAATTFTAPTLPAGANPVVLTFQLVACNGYACGTISAVTITVTPAVGPPQMAMSASPGQNVVPNTKVTLTGTASGGTGAVTHTFVQTAGPAQALTAIDNAASFTATLPPGTAPPATLTFTDTVTDAAAHSATGTISVFVGADTLTVPSASYTLSSKALTVVVKTTAVPKGSAVIMVTPLAANGLAIGEDIICTYKPAADAYSSTATVNPIPSSVRIKSSYGGAKTSPVFTVQ